MKAVMLSGGGIDSTVLLVFLKKMVLTEPEDELTVLHIFYGQKAWVGESAAIKHFADKYKVLVRQGFADLRPIASAAILEGSEVGLSKEDNKLEGRNCILVTLAATYAATIGASTIYVGFHAYPQGAPPPFPDETPIAVDVMEGLLGSCYATDPPLELRAPFHSLQKIDLLAMGVSMDADVATKSFTCYEAGDKECGRCVHCLHKAEMLKTLERNGKIERAATALRQAML